MRRYRLPTVVLTAATVATLTVGVTVPAYAASPSPTPEQLAAAAQDAADAANQAFIERRWDAVLAHADAFDASQGDLVALRDHVAAQLEELESGDLVHALAEYEAAEALHREKQVARNRAKKEADAAAALVTPVRQDRNAAVQALQAANAEVARLEALVVEARGEVDAAEQVATGTGEALASAAAAFDGPIVTNPQVRGWLDDLGVAVPSYRALLADRDDAAATAPGLRDEADVAYDRYETAADDAQRASTAAVEFSPKHDPWWCLLPRCRTQGYQDALDVASAAVAARAAAWSTWLEADADADRAERRASLYAWIVDAVDAEQVRDALVTAQDEHDSALAALATLQSDLDALEGDLDQASIAVAEAQDVRDAKQEALNAAKREAERLALLKDEAQAALMAVKPDRDEKKAIYEALLAQQSQATAELDALNALLDGLSDAQRDVADRRADLEDLEQLRAEVVWSVGDTPGVVRPGDTVTVPFTIPGSSTYDLSDVTVAVAGAPGAAPACDVPADGVVPAGTVVSCTVEHEVTEADLDHGAVALEVTLSGYVPLGPGNPRARAVTRTLVESSTLVEVPVEMLLPGVETETDADAEAPTFVERPVVVEETDTGEVLAATGGELGLVAPATMLALTGAALVLIARRREEA